MDVFIQAAGLTGIPAWLLGLIVLAIANQFPSIPVREYFAKLVEFAKLKQ